MTSYGHTDTWETFPQLKNLWKELLAAEDAKMAFFSLKVWGKITHIIKKYETQLTDVYLNKT